MLKPKQIITFCEYMAYQADAGIPINTSLKNCAKQLDEASAQKIMRALQHILEDSMPLYEALDQVDVLPTGAISAIKAGESSGRLVIVFEEIADFYGRFDSIISDAVPKLLAPLGYIVFGTLIFFGFIMFLFPMMIPAEKLTGPDPDILVKMVIFGISVRENITMVLVGIGALLGFIVYAISNSEIKEAMLGVALSIPIIGRGLYELYMAMWAKFFSILQTAGVPYKQTLSLTREMVPAAMFKEFDLLDQMEKEKNAELIQDDSLVPTTWPIEFTGALQMGLPSGRTPQMLSKAADRIMVTGQNKINNFISIANKLGLVLTGLLIAGLVISVMAINFSQLEI